MLLGRYDIVLYICSMEGSCAIKFKAGLLKGRKDSYLPPSSILVGERDSIHTSDCNAGKC